MKLLLNCCAIFLLFLTIGCGDSTETDTTSDVTPEIESDIQEEESEIDEENENSYSYNPADFLNVDVTVEGSLTESDIVMNDSYIDLYYVRNVPSGAHVRLEVDPLKIDAIAALYRDNRDKQNSAPLEKVFHVDSAPKESTEIINWTLTEGGNFFVGVYSHSKEERGTYVINYRITDQAHIGGGGGGGGGSYEPYESKCASSSKYCGQCRYFDYSTCSCRTHDSPYCLQKETD